MSSIINGKYAAQEKVHKKFINYDVMERIHKKTCALVKFTCTVCEVWSVIMS